VLAVEIKLLLFNNEIVPFVHSVKSKNIPIAAICGATLFLADIGILDNIRHTSNAREYLQTMSSAYKGSNLYQEVRAVSDNNIITASGIAPIEFAREIFLKLELYELAMIEKWFQLFKNGVWVKYRKMLPNIHFDIPFTVHRSLFSVFSRLNLLILDWGA
jgi:hypothetical protein